MTELRIKMLEILEDTKTFYHENPSKRGIVLGKCCYLNSENGNKCAVGRCLSDEDIEIVHAREVEGWLSSIWDIWNMITTPKIKSLPMSFWNNLQSFHDCDHHWNEDGISENGLREYEDIKNKIIAGKFV